ncbi:helix-turn-helix transcriptional regulator [Gramella sp. AN32]|uniref:Response regulator transcription factor n=1 Tax=Christiangramia antarctica TaxID=2058158 RepID=A0ABW5X2Q4_9FLAO|nr:helix-turn-helix transcriptional regulator [Gramella sp. AN32]MCM4157068.1 hypothetical protein [Gramella sp. AN32]
MKFKSVADKISKLSPYAEMMPGILIIHKLKPFKPLYITSNGLTLGFFPEESKNPNEHLHERFFNNEDLLDLLLKLEKHLIKGDPKETFTFFQRVRIKEKLDWIWHIASTRIFMQSEEGIPTHIITISIPIDQMKHVPVKATRFLEESLFYNRNFEKFMELRPREKEVMIYVAKGLSSHEISDRLFISKETVNTHRKNIKQKLSISCNYEFTEYAQAFDLI